MENELSYLKKNYEHDFQILIDKEILLTKQINKIKIDDINNLELSEDNKIIKFNRNEFDDFTIIKVNYVQPEY